VHLACAGERSPVTSSDPFPTHTLPDLLSLLHPREESPHEPPPPSPAFAPYTTPSHRTPCRRRPPGRRGGRPSGARRPCGRQCGRGYVNEIAKKIHAVDPDHPVTSTDAWTGAWPYYKKNAPDLDLYAVNSYDAVCDIRSTRENGGYDKPYIVTEGGPAGEWEVPDDANGVPEEPTDVAKAAGYKSAWDCVNGHPEVSLGATLFPYGTEYDFGGVWFNLLPAGQKRLSYYAVKEAFGAGTSGDNTPPVISGFDVDNASVVPAGRTFRVNASVTDPDGDALTHQVLFSSK